jgi:hypothetical protein
MGETPKIMGNGISPGEISLRRLNLTRKFKKLKRSRNRGCVLCEVKPAKITRKSTEGAIDKHSCFLYNKCFHVCCR